MSWYLAAGACGCSHIVELGPIGVFRLAWVQNNKKKLVQLVRRVADDLHNFPVGKSLGSGLFGSGEHLKTLNCLEKIVDLQGSF